ncbi:MAG: flagellin FliC [Xanthomonadaceae bacterium]|nr:flagellin FliC [Xanthomonadaceae bacterium]
MGLRIATNVQALAAQRFLATNNKNQQNSIEHLASGSRINRAGDDAAGLAISEKLRANIRSMQQATRNASDGISLIQTAEGAMNEISNIFIRVRELSIQGANDTLSDVERGFLDKEVQNLKQEIDRIAQVTEFNGRHLLNGEGEVLEFQVGLNNNPMEDRIVFNTSDGKVTLDAFGLGDISTASKESSRDGLDKLDAAISQLNGNRSTLGALQNRLTSTVNNMQIYTENLSAANSRIRDTDMATESSELVRNNILTQANISVLGQANMNPQAALKLIG